MTSNQGLTIKQAILFNKPSQALQILQSKRISFPQTKLNNRTVIPLNLQMICGVLLPDHAWAMV